MTNKLLYLILSIICLCFDKPINAQDFHGNEDLTTNIQEIKFIPPQDGEPPETKGAGTRNPEDFQCSNKPNDLATQSETVKAIMPDRNYGLTTQEYPEIYIDLAHTSAKQVVLSIRDRNRKYDGIFSFSIEPKSRIVGFSLPKDRLGLRENIDYQWQIVFVCGDRLDVNDPVMSGWIRRQSPNINMDKLSTLSTIERADWYAKNGYWYDFISQVKLLEDRQLLDRESTDVWQDIIDKY